MNIFRTSLGLGILAMGFVVLASPEIGIYTLATLLGISFALEGISLIFDSSYWNNKSVYSLVDLSLGSIFSAVGVIIMIDTNINIFLIGIFTIVIAFLSLLHQIMVCYERKMAGLKYEVVASFGLVHLIYLVLIIYSIATGGTLFTTFIGTYLLNLGIIVITAMVYKRHDREQG